MESHVPQPVFGTEPGPLPPERAPLLGTRGLAVPAFFVLATARPSWIEDRAIRAPEHV